MKNRMWEELGICNGMMVPAAAGKGRQQVVSPSLSPENETMVESRDV